MLKREYNELTCCVRTTHKHEHQQHQINVHKPLKIDNLLLYTHLTTHELVSAKCEPFILPVPVHFTLLKRKC